MSAFQIKTDFLSSKSQFTLAGASYTFPYQLFGPLTTATTASNSLYLKVLSLTFNSCLGIVPTLN